MITNLITGLFIGILIGIPVGAYGFKKALLAYLHGEFERIGRMIEEEKNEQKTC